MMNKLTEGQACRWIGTTNFCCNTVEHESERVGDFRLFRTTCRGQTYYSVADKDGDELNSFKDLKSAQEDINEKHAKVLQNQSDPEFQRLKVNQKAKDNVDTKDIHTDSREV